MKTIVNKTKKPLKIRLPGDKTLFLGATRRAQMRDDALEHPPVKKLLEAGSIEVLDASAQHAPGKGPAPLQSQGGQQHSSSRGKASSGDR
jgi:hypothetical protein